MLGRGKAAAAKMAKAMIFSNSHKEFAVGQGSWTDDGNTTNWIGVYTRSKDRRKCFSCFTTFHVCGNSFPAKLMGWGPVTDHWSSGQDSALSYHDLASISGQEQSSTSSHYRPRPPQLIPIVRVTPKNCHFFVTRLCFSKSLSY